MTAVEMDRSVAQIKAARQMDLPPKLVIPMRVIMSVAAISASWMRMCRSRRCRRSWSPVSPSPTPRSVCRRLPRIRRSDGVFPRPCGDVRADVCGSRSNLARGSRRPTHPRVRPVPARQSNTGGGSGSPRRASWRARGRPGSRRTTGRDRRHDTATPAASVWGLSGADMSCSPASWSVGCLASVIRTRLRAVDPITMATDPLTSGPWPFGENRADYLALRYGPDPRTRQSRRRRDA